MSTGVNREEVIERDLREILSRLDRALHRAHVVLGWTLVAGRLAGASSPASAAVTTQPAAAPVSPASAPSPITNMPG